VGRWANRAANKLHRTSNIHNRTSAWSASPRHPYGESLCQCKSFFFCFCAFSRPTAFPRSKGVVAWHESCGVCQNLVTIETKNWSPRFMREVAARSLRTNRTACQSELAGCSQGRGAGLQASRRSRNWKNYFTHSHGTSDWRTTASLSERWAIGLKPLVCHTSEAILRHI